MVTVETEEVVVGVSTDKLAAEFELDGEVARIGETEAPQERVRTAYETAKAQETDVEIGNVFVSWERNPRIALTDEDSGETRAQHVKKGEIEEMFSYFE